MLNSQVKFTSNLDKVQTEMLRQVTQHFKGTDFPAKCPKCSKDILISDGMNACPFCMAKIAFDLNIERN